MIITTQGSLGVSHAIASTAVADGGASLLFASDWSTDTGTGDAALRDTDKTIPWDEVSGGGTMEIISAAGLDFPTTNCARITATPEPFAAKNVRVHNQWATPASGDHLYFRVYMRTAVSESAPIGGNHPLQTNSGGGGCTGQGFNLKFDGRTDGKFNLRMIVPKTPVEKNKWDLQPEPPLDTDTTYRIEWHVFRTSTVEEYNLEIRVYDSNDNLLYSNADWTSASSGSFSLADDPPPVVIMEDDCLRHVGLGTNGPLWNLVSNHFFYWGAFAVGNNNWLGPWVSGEGP